MKTGQLPRKERERLRQRQEMIEAAKLLFSEKGYHKTSMQEIAEKAEFAIGTIYKFFPTKEDLYKTFVLEQYDAFDQALAQVVDTTKDEVEKLHDFVRIKGERFQNNLPFVRLMIAEGRGVSFNFKAGLDQELRSRYHGFLERLAFVFETGIQNRRFKPIASPFKMAVALDSTVNAFLLLWLDTPERYPFPEDPKAILDIFFKGLLEAN
ncbi:MAG: TetR/AcrR family transcriptional regulator [Deltaproteobacteria bacterium]|nr:TetR/AcrR family transcriptional regulator [Deltaproteobacteria bacterium]